MTREETKRIIMVIATTYPNFKPENMTNTVNVWTNIFKDYPHEVIEQATLNYIKNDFKGFAPVPGQIIASIETPNDNLTEQEAWELVCNALKNSSYESNKEFAKLPTECQQAIGSPTMLKELAIVDNYEVQSFERPRFEKRYREIMEKQRKMYKTPEGIQQALMERGRIGIAGEETQIR